MTKTSAKQGGKSERRGRPKGSTVREDILENAGAAFVKQGYHACTVEHILYETGVSRTNFYRFFKNKEEVFEAIFQDKIEKLFSQMMAAERTVPDKASARERLDLSLQSYLEACFSVEDLLPILILESQSLPKSRKIKETVLKGFLDRITNTAFRIGGKKPDSLLVEGFMAATDRILLVESQKQSSSDDKVARSKAAILKFFEVFL